MIKFLFNRAILKKSVFYQTLTESWRECFYQLALTCLVLFRRLGFSTVCLRD